MAILKVQYIVTALENLNGIASLSDIYQEVKRITSVSDLANYKASIRAAIEFYSSDSKLFKSKHEDLFFSAKGIGSGIWGLRSYIAETPKASDIEHESDEKNEVADSQIGYRSDNETPKRALQKTYRILRDTQLARKLKLLHKHHCQLCNTSITLANGKRYSEAHHIKPLGRPHNGPDVPDNIIILCPNHHVMLDYGTIKLDSSKIQMKVGHSISQEFINYHNENIFGFKLVIKSNHL